MPPQSILETAIRRAAEAAGLAAGVYAGYAAVTWFRYGHPSPPDPGEGDELLDRFMPNYEVVERHHVRVAAPADVTLIAARDVDLQSQPVVRAVFKGRELILGSSPRERRQPQGLLAEVQALGWGLLAEVPGREIVVGAVTRPWEPDVTFRPVPPDEFAAFAEADYVKIAWTVRADPDAAGTSIFRTETRAAATDAAARVKFRRYWSLLSPGILLIRRMMVGAVKADAERRAHPAAAPAGGPDSAARAAVPSPAP
jgi:hypothetical protein